MTATSIGAAPAAPPSTSRTPDAAEVAERYGTPTFVYELDAVRRAHDDLRAALPPGAGVYYSLKANPHPEIVSMLHELGCDSEVSSSGEADVALDAGVPAARVLMTGPGKTAVTLAHALDRGVRRYSVDSPTDLARLERLAGARGVEVDCLLRINADKAVPGAGLAMTGTASQFGADLSWVLADPGAFSGGAHTRVRGLHLYMGTNLLDEDVLVAQFEVGIAIAARLVGVLPEITEVDLGGGFGLPFARHGSRPTFPGLAAAVSQRLDAHLPTWRDGVPHISFETGRYLVGDCGSLVARVVDLKKSKGVRFGVLDTGVHHLGGMSGLRRIPMVGVDVHAPHADLDDDDPVTVVGPLCTPLDVLGRGLHLPGLAVDDLVTIPNTGAYGPTASLLAFLGHPAPVELVTRGGAVVSASQLSVTRIPH